MHFDCIRDFMQVITSCHVSGPSGLNSQTGRRIEMPCRYLTVPMS